MALTVLKAAFVREYQVDQNATQAAIRAGYSEKTAYSQGSRLLKDVEVQQALQQVAATALQVVESRLGEGVASAARIVEEASRIAFGDIRDLVTWDGESVTLHDSESLTPEQAAMVKEVRVQRSTTKQKDGTEFVSETREVKVWDKLAALNLLAKRFPSVFAPEAGSSERGARHLHLHGLSESELRAIASGLRA